MKNLAYAALTILLVQIASTSGLAQTPKTIIDLPAAVSLTAGQQLQDAVNDPANTNVILRLAPGSYVLDRMRGPVSAGGRLVLQQGMDIVGANQYADSDGDGVYDPVGTADQFTLPNTETFIDASVIAGQQAAVRIGRDNSLARVTVHGANAGGSVQINLQSADGAMRGAVRDCILQGGSVGIRCNNPQPAPTLLNDTLGQATLERNIVRNTLTWGIIINNPSSDGNIWEAVVQYNRIYSNTAGVFILGNQSAYAQTTVASKGNLIESNKVGVLVMSGQDVGAQRPAGQERGATNNEFTVISHEDVIRYNIGSIDVPNLRGNLGGGVVALAAGNQTAGTSPSSGNKLMIQFLGTRFQDNFWKTNGATVGSLNHVTAFGYWTLQNRTEYGVDNTTRVRVRLAKGDSLANGFWVKNSVPADPTGSNQAIVFNSDAGLFQEADDQGFPNY